MSRLEERRKRQAQSAPPAKTSSGDRVTVIDASSSPDTTIQQALNDNYMGKLKAAEGKELIDKSRVIHRVVREMVLKNRAADRPKMFRFKGQAYGVAHQMSVQVKEGGYGEFDDKTKEQIIAITGEAFVKNSVTETTTCVVDFSLVPAGEAQETDADGKPVFNSDGSPKMFSVQDKVDDLLEQINEICGADVAVWKFGNKPKADFHKDRTKLTIEQDRQLERILPAAIAFSK